MKKHIFILTLALFALGLSVANAQLAPNQVTCLSPDALHPMPGTPYTYSVNVPAPPSGNWDGIHYRWFVTQSQTFINNFNFAAVVEASGGAFMDVTGGSAYNVAYNGPGTLPNIEITWKSFVYNPAQPVFVGILVVGENGVCNPNNMKIYRIEPLHAFTLDIANVQNGAILPGYGSNVNNCISDILGATYVAADDAISYDFGVDTFYYAVAAANWSGQWELRAQLAGIQTGQTASLHWGYWNANFGAVTFDNLIVSNTPADGNWTSSVLVLPQGGATSVGAAGQTIFIRLILNHGSQFEGTNNVQYTLAVNGSLHDGAAPIPGYADIHFEGSCAQVDFDDIALQTLLARPTIQNTTPGAAFLPIAP